MTSSLPTIDAIEALLSQELASVDAEDGVGLAIEGPVAIVTLARPRSHNALTLAGWNRLATLFERVLPDEAPLRAVVVRGAGENAFSTGADIKEFQRARSTPELADHYNSTVARALQGVSSLNRPVIAMTRGLVVGGGCELAAACDVRIASEDARFGIPIGKIGVALGYVETRILVQLLGPARVKDLVFSGRLIDADEAHRIGLVDRLVPRSALLRETAELLNAIFGSAPISLRAAKLVVEMCCRTIQPSDAETLAQITSDTYASEDLREGISAFIERRPPAFQGR